jgi:hypothetical protein
VRSNASDCKGPRDHPSSRVIADHDVDLVRLAAERDLRDRTAPVETFEARTAHGTQRFEGCTTGFEMAAAGGRGFPGDDDDNSPARRDRIGRDLALRGARMHAPCPDNESRLWIDDRAIASRYHPLPACRNDETNAVGADDIAAARGDCGRRQSETNEHNRHDAHHDVYAFDRRGSPK